MKYLLIVLCLFSPLLTYASLPIQVPLDELVKNADHVMVGHIVGVDMINKNGEQITDLEAKTGPGSTDTIRLIVNVDEVIVSNVKNVPSIIKVPLDPFMHYSLGQIKQAHSEEAEKLLLLLKGSNFQPPFPGVFGRDISEKAQIIQLIKSNNAN